MGSEVKEYGVDILLGPALNTHRNPLGGRNFEYYSEDPLVSGRMAAAMVKGVQSQGVGTSIKHFVANDHEWNRNTIDVKVSQRALREIYLRGFEIAVRESRPWTIMSSYNKLNGTYTSESTPLLTGVARNDWQYDGLVMTDWFGGQDAVAQMNAGNELLMPGAARQQKALLAAVASGALKKEILDRNVERVLELIARTPAFQGYKHSDAPDLAAHAAVGRVAAAEGMVLLRNAGVLPLATSAKLAVLGNTSYAMITGGTGSGDVNEAYTISLMQGLAKAGFSVDAALAESYAAHIKAEEAKRPARPMPFMLPQPLPERVVSAEEIGRLARETDVALVTIGRNSGEFTDRKRENDFELSKTETALLQQVSQAFHAQKKKVLVVLNIGGVIETASWRELADAILLAWQPGQESGYAIADVLSGHTPPSGKLATTFPMKWEDVPSSANFPGKTLLGPDPERPRLHVGGSSRRGRVRRRHLGWLSSFRDEGREARLSLRVRPLLHRVRLQRPDPRQHGVQRGDDRGGEGDECRKGRGTRSGPALPWRRARSHRSRRWSCVGLPRPGRSNPGESEILSFTLTGRDLASFDEPSSSWLAEAGTYTVKVGASSSDIRQTATFVKAKEEKVASVSTSVGPAAVAK